MGIAHPISFRRFSANGASFGQQISKPFLPGHLGRAAREFSSLDQGIARTFLLPRMLPD